MNNLVFQINKNKICYSTYHTQRYSFYKTVYSHKIKQKERTNKKKWYKFCVFCALKLNRKNDILRKVVNTNLQLANTR